jgi:hypothetical protein
MADSSLSGRPQVARNLTNHAEAVKAYGAEDTRSPISAPSVLSHNHLLATGRFAARPQGLNLCRHSFD